MLHMYIVCMCINLAMVLYSVYVWRVSKISPCPDRSAYSGETFALFDVEETYLTRLGA
jgi:hypothetical protein